MAEGTMGVRSIKDGSNYSQHSVLGTQHDMK